MPPSAKQEVWRVVVTLAVVVVVMARGIAADVVVLSENRTVIFADAAAKFGPLIPLEGFRGMAAAVSPAEACTVPNPPPSPTTTMYVGPWIALVKRDHCSFTDKVLNAQIAGYNAVIVYNVGSNELIHMWSNDSAKASKVNIPSVFIAADDGFTIIKYYTYLSGEYLLEITGDLPFNLAKYLVPFAITIGICFIVMLSFMLAKCVRDYRRSRRHRLSSRALKKLPLHKFKKGDPYECCAICLEDYVDNDKLRVLPCEHAYHSKCIDPWLTNNRRVCPVCKRKVIMGNERPSDFETDSEDENSPLINSEGGTQGGTFTNQRENPFMQAMREAGEQRQNRRRRTPSRHVECGPEGYQRLAESSSEEEEEGDVEDVEEEGEEQREEERGTVATLNQASSGAVEVDEARDATTVTVVVHDGPTRKETPTDMSSLTSYGTPPGPVQIAVDIVNSTDSTSDTEEPAAPLQQPDTQVRSDHDFVV